MDDNNDLSENMDDDSKVTVWRRSRITNRLVGRRGGGSVVEWTNNRMDQ